MNSDSSMQKDSLPHHVGIILDGNRRWAKQRGLSAQEGHKRGFDMFRHIADASLERGISYLSVFVFSTENWNRTKDEVSFLMRFIQIVMNKYISELTKKNIRFIWFGSENGLDTRIVKMLHSAEESSKNNSAGTFCLCFNYGGQQEIAEAAQKLADSHTPITVDTLSAELYGGTDVPPIDLVIRTSGEQRLSNFMLWRAAYSELYFTDILWPDFTPKDLDDALAYFAARKRRYGA